MVAAKDFVTNLTSQQLPRVSEPLGKEPASSESCILLVDSLKAAGQQSQMRLTRRRESIYFRVWGFVAFTVIPNRGAAQLQLQLAWSGGAVYGGLTDHLTLRPGCPSSLVGARGLSLPAPISSEVRAKGSGRI
ncbi:unnamed protein product [Fusarium fujikuroi]|uniref:Uncharacterized protein n=1 Tax=Fusarium fujikuroi TaxID=5127 RepID=A0A9Q9RT24_FUSFU|nr:unnamed protein product [Fusarium fujikuroi]VZH98328.1 unnamed protein product [Fusarium fujikuroi]